MADKKNQRFTIDADKDGQEVPTLTKLLYKKNVVKAQGSPGSGRQSPGLRGAGRSQQNPSDIMTLEPTLTTTENPVMASTPIPEPEPAPLAQPINAEFVVSDIASNIASPLNIGLPQGGPRDRRVMPAATPFTMPEIVLPVPPSKYAASAPAAAGIQSLATKAKLEASLVFVDAGEAYVLKSIVGVSKDRTTLWNGMEISKATFSDLIGRLEKFGFAEFSTLGAAGAGNFDRMTFRNAFQAKGTEWVTLVLSKSPSGPSAIVAFFSAGSIQMHLPAFHSAGMPTAKAA